MLPKTRTWALIGLITLILLPLGAQAREADRGSLASFLDQGNWRQIAARPGEAIYLEKPIPPELVERIVERGMEKGFALNPSDVVASSVYFRAGDSLDEMAEISARALPALAVCAGTGAVLGAVPDLLRWTGILENPAEDPVNGWTVLESAGVGAVCSTLACALAPKLIVAQGSILVTAGGRTLLSQTFKINPAKTGLSSICKAIYNTVVDSFAYEFEGAPGTCYQEVHGVRTWTAAGMHTWSENCVGPAIFDPWQAKFTELDALVASQPSNSEALVPFALLVDDGTHYESLVPATATLKVEYQLIPNAPGSHELSLGVEHLGQSHLLRTIPLVVDPADLGSPIEGNAMVPASELLGLQAGGGNDFDFYLESSSFSQRFYSLDGNRLRIRIDDGTNQPPSAAVTAIADFNSVRFFGSYRDADGNPASLLQLQVEGPNGFASVDLLPYLDSGDPSGQLDYEFPTNLVDGPHVYRLRFSDGIHGVRDSGDFDLRVSSTPPSVHLGLAQTGAGIGESVSATVTVVDAAGGVPGAEIGLASDISGTFFDSAGNAVTKVTTSASGSASFTYEPANSGRHTLLAMEPSFRFDYVFLDVAGNPSDWTADWSWSVVSNSDIEATYDAQVEIRYQGQPLDPGDNVFFAANHGQWQQGEDQVGDSSVANDTYSLSKIEADSGDEIFTLSLPKYGVELRHVDNLAVGAPASLVESRSANFFAHVGDDWGFAIDVSDDGRYLARADGERVTIYDFPTFAALRTVDLNRDDLNALDFSPDSKRLVTADQDGYVSIIDLEAGSSIIQRGRTDGSADIHAVDWYDHNRIALATDGRTGYQPRVMIVDANLNFVGSSLSFGLTENDEIIRVRCSAATSRCVMTSFNPTFKWAVFTTGGQILGQGFHPDPDTIHVATINPAGDRVFVAGEKNSNGGARFADLFSVSSSGISPLPSPITSNLDVYAGGFLIDENGLERLALGGRDRLEIFDRNGGVVLRDVVDPASTNEKSYHLEYLPGPRLLAAIDNASQTFFNLSGDFFGPSISLPQPAPLPYRESSIRLSGTLTDPSEVTNAEFRLAGGAWSSLLLDDAGRFEIEIDPLPVGETLVEIRASDALGNSSQANVIVERLDDVSGPLISQVSVSPAVGPRGTLFTLEARVEDLDSSVATVTVEVLDEQGEMYRSATMTTAGPSTYRAVLDSLDWESAPYDLAISASDSHPAENTTRLNRAASVEVEGRLFEDGFESGNTTRWSTVEP